MGFKNVLKAELYKLAKAKALIKVLVAMIIIFIAITLLYSFLYNLIGGISINGVEVDGQPTYVEIDEETVKEAEAACEQYKVVFDNEKPNVQLMDTTPYMLKAQAAAYRYMYENHLDLNSVTLFGSSLNLSTNSYMMFIMQTMSVVIMVYAMVSVIRLIAGERNNGALKMQLLRPISKDAMLFAKGLAVTIMSIALFIFIMIVAAIVGIIAYNFDAKTVLLIFNGASVHEISALAEIFIYFIYYCSVIVINIVLAMFLSTIIKKNEGMSIAFAMISVFVGSSIENILGYAFIGYAGFNVNAVWINAFTVNGPAMNYMNFYSMMGISIAWMAIMLVASVFSFRHTEIHN